MVRITKYEDQIIWTDGEMFGCYWSTADPKVLRSEMSNKDYEDVGLAGIQGF